MTGLVAQAALLPLGFCFEASRELDVRALLEVAASRDDVLIVVVGERLSPWSRWPACFGLLCPACRSGSWRPWRGLGGAVCG